MDDGVVAVRAGYLRRCLLLRTASRSSARQRGRRLSCPRRWGPLIGRTRRRRAGHARLLVQVRLLRILWRRLPYRHLLVCAEVRHHGPVLRAVPGARKELNRCVTWSQAEERSCTAESFCKTCNHDGECKAVKNARRFFVKEFGKVSGEKEMMAEIAERGPIACGLGITQDFFDCAPAVQDVSHAVQTRVASSWTPPARTRSATLSPSSAGARRTARSTGLPGTGGPPG